MGAFTSMLAAAGIGMQAYGMYRSGQDAYAAGAYNQQIYEQQAQIIDVKKGITKAQYDRMIKRLSGETIVATASSGYDMTGSFLEVYNDNMTQAFLERDTELYNLEVDKFMAKSAGAESLRAGERARRTANISAASSLLVQGNEWYQKYGGFGKTDSKTEPIIKAKKKSSWPTTTRV
jgi:hypothetical protein